MKVYGFLRSFLIVCHALGIHVFLDSLVYMRTFRSPISRPPPQILFLSFFSCTFGVSIVWPNSYFWPQTVVACSLSFSVYGDCFPYSYSALIEFQMRWQGVGEPSALVLKRNPSEIKTDKHTPWEYDCFSLCNLVPTLEMWACLFKTTAKSGEIVRLQ